jgi:hypothetical protein
MFLTPIKYGKRAYPEDIKPQMQEIAGHFDIASIKTNMPFSLHTEYSYGKRKFTSDLLSEFQIIKNSHHNFVPKLWVNHQWSKEFSQFIHTSWFKDILPSK